VDFNQRIPLPLDAALSRIKLKPIQTSPCDVLNRVTTSDSTLQDFSSLTESLEWELSALHWNRAGLFPFVENDVPFLVNNSGFLSEHAAAVVFANCVEAPPQGDIRVLELGAGMGLFARYFLDAFRAVCRQEGRDFYDRLTYYVSDRSLRTTRQWLERAQFANHEGRVVVGTSDATNPCSFCANDGPVLELEGLRAVFCNYVLDVLPATVVRKGAAGAEELRIRTHLTEDRTLLSQYTRLSVDDIRRMSRASDAEEKARLIDLLSLLEFETNFLQLQRTSPLIDEALEAEESRERVVVNTGAIECLEACLQRLDRSGFVMVNDYGPVQSTQVSGHATSQRFGPTSALGLNFPLLECYFGRRERVLIKPEGDDERGVHARLLMNTKLEATCESFNNRFGPAGVDFYEVPCEDARRHIAAGRKSDALDCYRLALSRNPRSWQLTGEIAEFVGLQLQDFASGRELIRSALEHNPWYSPWLWNVLGDILFLDKDVAGAHEAYLQAQKIHPRDVRTNLDLAYTHFEFGRFEDALNALSTALAADVRGMFRARLLEKQHQVLGAIAGRWHGEQERLARRAERMMQR
jgi:tetratricopeptide (TPR) repeat protein